MAADWMHELKSETLNVPGEGSPLGLAGASDEYLSARQTLVDAKVALHNQVLAVAAMRQALPPGPIPPRYEFTEGPADLAANSTIRPVTLMELFGDHNEPHRLPPYASRTAVIATVQINKLRA